MLKIAISVMWSVIVLWVPGNETIMSCHKPILLRNNSLSHTLPPTTPSLSQFLLRQIYTVQLCHIQQACDRPTTWNASFKSNLQLAYNNCCVVPKSCYRPIVSLLCATKSYRINEPLQLLVAPVFMEVPSYQRLLVSKIVVIFVCSPVINAIDR